MQWWCSLGKKIGFFWKSWWHEFSCQITILGSRDCHLTFFWHGKIGFSCIHTTNFIVRRLDADLFLTRNPNIFTKAQWSEFPNFIQQLKVSKSRKQFMVSSILPKNKQKQFNLRYHKSKVEFVHSFFGRIEATINPSIYNILRWVAWMMGQANCRPRVWCSKYYLFLYFL